MIITVVGNYPKIPNRPRPARLRNAYNRLDRGEIGLDEVRQVEDQVTEEVLKEQAAAGVELLTDGQIRWQDEQTYIAGRLGGITLTGLIRFFDTNTFYRQPLVEAPIAWKEPVTVRDYRFAVERVDRPVKPVLTGPVTLARLSKDEHYRDAESLALGFAEALNQEARALEAAGATLVQFNEPLLTRRHEDATFAPRVWRRLLAGLASETAVYFYFGLPGPAFAAAVEAGFVTIGVDLTVPGALGALAESVRPPKLAAGAINSRTTRLETHAQVVETICAAAALVAPDNLYVNPNMGLEFLPREQAYDKLVRLVEGVDQARKTLT